jgi:hypothetical protein
MAKGRTTRNGYGWKHQQERARMKRLVDAGQAFCARCGQWIEPGTPWDLGHPDRTERTVYSGAEHRRCNRATATHRKQRFWSRNW